MIELERYMNDGANWQAQAVLALLRGIIVSTLELAYDKVKNYNRATIKVGRYENCREQGYVFSLMLNWQTIYNIAVYEHRNSDCICVKGFEGDFFNTPRADDLGMKDKWDYDKSFECGKVFECAEWIDSKFEEKLTDALDALKPKEKNE